MKIKENIKIRKIGNEKILIVNDGQKIDYTCVVSLNDSAAFLLETTGKDDFSTEKWAEWLVAEYGIDLDIALNDASALVNKLHEAGIIET
jgi:hypothetical protein